MATFYCPACNARLDETENDIYVCPRCHTDYSLSSLQAPEDDNPLTVSAKSAADLARMAIAVLEQEDPTLALKMSCKALAMDSTITAAWEAKIKALIEIGNFIAAAIAVEEAYGILDTDAQSNLYQAVAAAFNGKEALIFAWKPISEAGAILARCDTDLAAVLLNTALEETRQYLLSHFDHATYEIRNADVKYIGRYNNRKYLRWLDKIADEVYSRTQYRLEQLLPISVLCERVHVETALLKICNDTEKFFNVDGHVLNRCDSYRQFCHNIDEVLKKIRVNVAAGIAVKRGKYWDVHPEKRQELERAVHALQREEEQLRQELSELLTPYIQQIKAIDANIDDLVKLREKTFFLNFGRKKALDREIRAAQLAIDKLRQDKRDQTADVQQRLMECLERLNKAEALLETPYLGAGVKA